MRAPTQSPGQRNFNSPWWAGETTTQPGATARLCDAGSAAYRSWQRRRTADTLTGMPEVTIQQAMHQAVVHHQAGRLAQAEAIYRQILAGSPNHPVALHMLGVLAFQAGQVDTACDLVGRAVAVDPSDWECHANLGKILAAQDRHSEAVAALHRALALKPAPDPASADLCNNLGAALENSGQFDEAIDAYRRAIALQPNYPDAYNNLGVVLGRKRLIDQAIDAFRHALTLRRDFPDASYNLGMSLREKGDLAGAIAAFEQAALLRPDFANFQLQSGISLHAAGRNDESIGAFRRAIAIRPDFVDAHNNLGTALTAAGRFDDARAAFRAALAIQPDHPSAHFNLGMSLLTSGEFSEGWPQLEWRWEMDPERAWRHRLTRPRWDGHPPEGRRILLYAEQGFGDTIQFVRYVPMVAARSGRVILECQPELVRLLQGVPGVERLIARGGCDEALPDHDMHCPLMSLPMVMKTTLQTIPAEIPYLRCDAELSSRWRERLLSGTLNVGLAWAGRPSHTNDRNRSMPLSMLAPLARVPNVSFISLQKEHSASPGTPGEGRGEGSLPLIDWTGELDDLADTAALIDNLDLVITVDTATAHLAGALGKPVWVLLPFVPDWRWMLDRTDSPWYPTMRLFRQPALGQWSPVVRDVVQALQSLRIRPR
jgi:Flp pilus assembly protein TadD